VVKDCKVYAPLLYCTPVPHKTSSPFFFSTSPLIFRNGGSICMNSSCSSYQTVTKNRNRYVEAAKCITIASTCETLKEPRPLPPACEESNQSIQYRSVNLYRCHRCRWQPVTDIPRTLHQWWRAIIFILPGYADNIVNCIVCAPTMRDAILWNAKLAIQMTQPQFELANIF
jgi:hypothetical protein